uniref:Uncharacterized protein n=1 Tax=Angiostrongylus cantonensis TaxID=6313 RepID=A0A0K0D6A6_ANGCA
MRGQPEDSQQVRDIEMEPFRARTTEQTERNVRKEDEMCDEGTIWCLVFGGTTLEENSWWVNINMQFY